MGIWPQKPDFSIFGVKFPFFQEGHSLFCFQIDSTFYSRLPLKKGKGLKGEKMAPNTLQKWTKTSQIWTNLLERTKVNLLMAILYQRKLLGISKTSRFAHVGAELSGLDL